MCVNLVLRFITLPVSTYLFIGCSIAGIGVEEFSKAVIPLLLASVIGLSIITFIPDFVLG